MSDRIPAHLAETIGQALMATLGLDAADAAEAIDAIWPIIAAELDAARLATIRVAEFASTMIGNACDRHKAEIGNLPVDAFVARHTDWRWPCAYCRQEKP